MKLVCIDNIFSGERIPFTIGVVYDTIPFKHHGGLYEIRTGNENTTGWYQLLSDNGVVYNLSTSRFIKLDEWREVKINKILSE